MDQKIPTIENITQFLASMGYTAIPFRQNVAGQLLINAKLNGVDGVYILDSGWLTKVMLSLSKHDKVSIKSAVDRLRLTVFPLNVSKPDK